MNTLLVTFIIFPLTVFSSTAAAAGEIFDSPGPGYRDQIDRLRIQAPPLLRVGPPIIYIMPSISPDYIIPTAKPFSIVHDAPLLADFLTLSPAFSTPIRLFDVPAQRSRLLSLDLGPLGAPTN